MATKFFLALVLYTPWSCLRSEYFDCRKRESVHQGVLSCYKNGGLGAVAGNEIYRLMVAMPKAVCRDKRRYLAAETCLYKLVLKCAPDRNQDYYSLASIQTVITRLCEKIGELNIGCLKEAFYKLQECIENKISVVPPNAVKACQ